MGAIVVKSLGKAYKQYPNRWSRLLEWLSPIKKNLHTLKWVIKDVNFHVKPGEALGVIGVNGAGKSTLLKMITATTQPTTGSVSMSGRVAALLELGMGFHPEFTGRQNAHMAAQLLGYSAVEISALMPSIEAFADIGDYIDRPVRVYSSGMQVRLAFSVATAIRPDILIIDEALSVGDAYFQHKSFERIREFRKQGTTLLIVSHDKAAIQSICDRAILLNQGRLAMEGEPEAVMNYYNALLADHKNQEVRQEIIKGGRLQTTSGTGEVFFETIELLNRLNESIEVVAVGEPVKLHLVAVPTKGIPDLTIGYSIKDKLGQIIFATNTYHLKHDLKDLEPYKKIDLKFSFLANLGEGTYSISCSLHEGKTHLAKNYEWKDLALVFTVVNSRHNFFLGTSWMPPNLTQTT